MDRSPRAMWAPRTATIVAAVATGLATGLARADDDATHSLQLEEVTVTATKRSESLQNVPVAVTALTAGVLERGPLTP
jgi:iron complex outermembrane receptor protein